MSDPSFRLVVAGSECAECGRTLVDDEGHALWERLGGIRQLGLDDPFEDNCEMVQPICKECIADG